MAISVEESEKRAIQELKRLRGKDPKAERMQAIVIMLTFLRETGFSSIADAYDAAESRRPP